MATQLFLNSTLPNDAQRLALRACDQVWLIADCLKAYTAIEQLMNPGASRLGLSEVDREHLFQLLLMVNAAVHLQLDTTIEAARDAVACAWAEQSRTCPIQ